MGWDQQNKGSYDRKEEGRGLWEGHGKFLYHHQKHTVSWENVISKILWRHIKWLKTVSVCILDDVQN